MKYRIPILAITCLTVLIQGGCITFEPTLDTTQFYVLNSQQQASGLPQGKSVLVRNVALADYLDNSQITRRDGPNRIVYLAQHRWAGSLKEMVTEVIADEINANHPGHTASVMERGNEERLLDVRIRRFDFQPDGEISLEMEYSVMDGKSPGTVRQERLNRSQACPDGATVGEVVSAMETVLRGAVNQMKLK